MYASSKGYTDILNCLLSEGAKPDHQNKVCFESNLVFIFLAYIMRLIGCLISCSFFSSLVLFFFLSLLLFNHALPFLEWIIILQSFFHIELFSFYFK